MNQRRILLITLLLLGITECVQAETLIYWTDHGSRNIRRTQATASGISAGEIVLDRSQLSKAFWGLEVDSLGQRLYWNEQGTRTTDLWRARLNGSQPEIFIPGLLLVTRFKIDDCRSLLFYVDTRGSTPELKRIKVREKQPQSVAMASTPSGDVVGLALDPRKKRVYLLSTKTSGNVMDSAIHSIGYSGGAWQEEARFDLRRGGIAGLPFHPQERTLTWGRNGGGKDRVIEGIALDGAGKGLYPARPESGQ